MSDHLQVPIPGPSVLGQAHQGEAGPSRPYKPTYANLHDIQPEIIIIGAGIAGCALAYSLSNAGRKVLLLERDLREPDRIVGELLQPGGIAALHKLGLAHCLDGIDAARVEGYCIVNGASGEVVAAPYPDLDAQGEGMGGEVYVEESAQEMRESAGSASGSSLEKREKGGEARWRKGSQTPDSDSGASTISDRASSTSSNQASSPPSSVDSDDVHPRKPIDSAFDLSTYGKEKSDDLWSRPSVSGRKEGRSFHHGRLISSLRRACLSAGPNLVVLEATVKDLVRCEHTERVIGVSAGFKVPAAAPALSTEQLTTGGVAQPEQEQDKVSVDRNVYAPLTIIADGCFSKFRTQPGSRIPKPQTRSHFVGVVLKDADMPMKYHGTVSLTPAGPVLMYQIGDEAEETRMLVDVKGKLPSVGDGSLKQHLIDAYLPHLLPQLRPSVLSALSTQRIRVMPNSFLPPSMQGLSSASSSAGMLLVGDAFNMRHPLTGGGMTVAFNDAVLLREYLGPERLGEGKEGLEDWARVSEGVREWFWKRKEVSGVVNVLSMALYSLFGGADEPDFEILRHGCFRYFKRGGKCISDPVGLLSVLVPTPAILFYHFFMVAFYSIFLLMRDGPPSTAPNGEQKQVGWAQRPGLALYSVKVFWTACVVLLPVIFTEFKV